MKSLKSYPRGLRQELLKSRIKNFVGYGNLKSDIWFVALEEGCDGSADGLMRRFLRTNGKKIIDPRPHDRWFGDGASIQPTWGKLIRILLAIEHPKKRMPDKEQVRGFQIEKFGKRKANHAMLDLMPLPCRSLQSWHYAEFGVGHLETRKSYERIYLNKRTELFQELIKKHGPKAVVFCGINQLHKAWRGIAGGKFKSVDAGRGKLHFKDGGRTRYFVIPHPAARQPHGNRYWHKIGLTIRRRVS